MPGYVHTTTTVVFTDMKPGASYELSAEFHYAAGGSRMIELGQSEREASPEGSVLFVVETHPLTQGHQGAGRFWLREPGTPQDADPVKDEHGLPALVHNQHLP